MKSPLSRLFKYIDFSIVPNIDVYKVKKQLHVKVDYDFIHFEPSYIKSYLWVYRYKKHYYSLVKLMNNKYMYLYGYISYNTTHFKFYISSDKQDALNCMKHYVKSWYLEDTNDTSC
jgi:hypothetical protein